MERNNDLSLNCVSIQWGTSYLQPGGMPFPGTRSTDVLILNAQSLKLWENKVCCLNHLIYGILLWSLNWDRAHIFLQMSLYFSVPIHRKYSQKKFSVPYRPLISPVASFLFCSHHWIDIVVTTTPKLRIIVCVNTSLLWPHPTRIHSSI